MHLHTLNFVNSGFVIVERSGQLFAIFFCKFV